ncbi:hypothetical protein QFZ22_000647 [Streptomyces canus]|uniref:Uncharacterized protein n=1 Tax=Streptomyces canus TaxID=58343 RepID=A0AAW8F494_9ACTN|nr:hypothetical protein [Streptomyces canus]MDQ0904662.1 hypothetical protein [Streptomyces canus]
MHDTLTAVTRPYAPDSPLAHLLDMAQAAGQPTEDEQREDAVTAAAHYVYNAYPDTLGRVLEAMDWTGHPALRAPDFGFEACATAWLDGGLWLHHTLRISEDGAFDRLTLIAPCTCGDGYTDIVLDSEDMLIEILAELRPTHGKSVHDESLGDCRSVQPVAPLGKPLAAL